MKIVIFLGFVVLLLLPACPGQDEPIVHDPGSSRETPLHEGVVGRVTDIDGNPIAGAIVEPKSLDDAAPAIPEIAVVTDAEGRYAWRLAPGRYKISIVAEGFRVPAKEVVVNANQVSRLDFILESAG